MASNKLKNVLKGALEEGKDICVASQVEVLDAVGEAGTPGMLDAVTALTNAMNRTEGPRHAAVVVLDMLAKNCGLPLLITLAHHPRYLEAAYALGADARAGATRKIHLAMIEAIATEFKEARDLQPLVQLYQDLRRRGCPFPSSAAEVPPASVPLLLPQAKSSPLASLAAAAARAPPDRLLHSDPVGGPPAAHSQSQHPSQLAAASLPDEEAGAVAIAVLESTPLGTLLALWSGTTSTVSAADAALLADALAVLESVCATVVDYPPVNGTVALLKKRAGGILAVRDAVRAGAGAGGSGPGRLFIPSPKSHEHATAGATTGAAAHKGAEEHTSPALSPSALPPGTRVSMKEFSGSAALWLQSRVGITAVASEEEVALPPRLILRRGSSTLQALSQASTPLAKAGGGSGASSAASSPVGTPLGGRVGGGAGGGVIPSTAGSPVVSVLSPATIVKNPFAVSKAV